MAKWNQCCDSWFRNQKPRHPKEGNFDEVHKCPTCMTPLIIVFNCIYPANSQTARGYGEDESELECTIHDIRDELK